MKERARIGSIIALLQVVALGLGGVSLAQESPPVSDEPVDEAPRDEDAAGPGFEVVPPSQGDAISILPLEEMPSEPQSDPTESVPDIGDEHNAAEDSPLVGEEETQPDGRGQPIPTQPSLTVPDASGFAPVQDKAEPQSLFLPSPATESSEQEPAEPLSYREVTIRALEKVTARTEDIVIPIGETVKFNSLDITMRTCNKRPPEEPPETTAFLEIAEEKSDGNVVKYFSGWMFASSPALNGLEHPVYDVWVIDCKISEPVKPVGIE
jgi:hypothetical protein